ncbi:hypothetical protein CRG98_042968 [Punica granatum]|uniref:Uncharacterized protein n=1 Tax=Punica granatum TaxID=22663 RepID=A0A2I0HY65_PUNGR|nr:hypothetical protein CRG98_042968 [Punica granatum]
MVKHHRRGGGFRELKALLHLPPNGRDRMHHLVHVSLSCGADGREVAACLPASRPICHREKWKGNLRGCGAVGEKCNKGSFCCESTTDSEVTISSPSLSVSPLV